MEIFPSFEGDVIERVLTQMGSFGKAFKHLQEFFDLVTSETFK